MKKLGDQEIMTAMDQLRAVYPNVDNLQHPVLGSRDIGKSLPRFQAVVQPFVQVLNIGDHWITATNKLSSNSNNNCLFDSSHSRTWPVVFTVIKHQFFHYECHGSCTECTSACQCHTWCWRQRVSEVKQTLCTTSGCECTSRWARRAVYRPAESTAS